MNNEVTTTTARRAAVDAFFEGKRLQRLETAAIGRLIFAIDATASRQPTWDMACELQAQMFAAVNGLSLQLVYYRGGGECKATRWFSDSHALSDAMRTILCRTGTTQIGRVLKHAQKEHTKQPVAGLVFVGDCMEENHEQLCSTARDLALPCFMFQEGDDPVASRTFAEIARLTKGAHCTFNAGAAQELVELLRAVAVYATGGLQALSGSGNAGAVKLLQQLK
jgi:hypothetical protein